MGNQFEYDFLTGDGIVAGSLNDMWQRFFDQEGIDGLNLNDRMMKYFGSLGYEGSLSDRYHRWEKGETPVVPPTAITDFAASDDEIEQFTFTWSNAGGTTPITYALFKDGVFQIDDVSSGLVLPSPSALHKLSLIFLSASCCCFFVRVAALTRHFVPSPQSHRRIIHFFLLFMVISFQSARLFVSPAGFMSER